jgi:serine/threonine protein kinase
MSESRWRSFRPALNRESRRTRDVFELARTRWTTGEVDPESATASSGSSANASRVGSLRGSANNVPAPRPVPDYHTDARTEVPLPEALDRYVMVDHLASGGMGELHVARHVGSSGIERLVVTKHLRLELIEDERAALMLVDEARIAATLYHRNLVQVHDVIVDAEQVMLVLEYFPSVNLAQLLDAIAGPLPYAIACAIVIELATALHYAHERTGDDGVPLEIVHRDVSLPNVLVGDHGHIKLTDFGVAKARSRLYVTRSATIKGKLGYMAPEQIRGAAVDRRADVFSLGVVLFEATTGVPLFTAGSDYETMRRIIEAEVPEPTSVRADYPTALAEIVRRAIASSPADRFVTAAELGLALQAIAADQGWRATTTDVRSLVRTHAPPGNPPWRREIASESHAWSARTTGTWSDG